MECTLCKAGIAEKRTVYLSGETTRAILQIGSDAIKKGVELV
jgi:hypothetical protein